MKRIEIPNNETILDALERLSSHEHIQEYCSEPYIKLKPVISVEQLNILEQQQGFPYPASLRNFSLNIANGFEFMVDPIYQEFEFFGLGEHSYYEVGNIGVFEFIRRAWYCHRTDNSNEIRNWYIEREYNTEEWLKAIDSVNDNYKVFGRLNYDNENQYLFVYGKNGKMGVVNFQQDWWEEVNELTNKQRMNDVLVYDSFETLISRLISVMTIDMTCRENDENDDEYYYLWKQWQTFGQ